MQIKYGIYDIIRLIRILKLFYFTNERLIICFEIELFIKNFLLIFIKMPIKQIDFPRYVAEIRKIY